MSIEDKDKIDAISIRKSDGKVILSISDHLDWKDEHFHLVTLQEKLNAYIQFIEGGQIFEEYPKSIGKKLVIEIVSQENFVSIGLEFLEKARPVVQSIGAELTQRTLIP